MSGAPFSLDSGPEFYADLDRIAAEGPVVAVRLRGVVDAHLLTRASDVAQAATDPRLTSDDSALRVTGSAPSRSTLKFGFTSVVHGLPALRLNGAPGWSGSVFHGPDRLPVAAGLREP